MRQHGQVGFTLIELLVVVAIIALVLSLAGLSVPTILDSSRLKAAEAALSGDIRLAQVRAIEEGRWWRVAFEPDGLGYSLEYLNQSVLPNTYQSCDVSGWVSVKRTRFDGTGSSGSSLKSPGISITDNNRTCIPFDGQGRAAWPVATYKKGVYSSQPMIAGREGNLFNNETLPDREQLATKWTPGYDPVADSVVVPFDREYYPQPMITVDLGTAVPLWPIKVGIASWTEESVGVPERITVDGAIGSSPPTDPSGWSRIGEVSVTDPSGGKPYRSWVKVPLSGTYRYIRLTLAYSSTPEEGGPYRTILDEIDINNTYFTIRSQHKSHQLVVRPFTGRVFMASTGP